MFLLYQTFVRDQSQKEEIYIGKVVLSKSSAQQFDSLHPLDQPTTMENEVDSDSHSEMRESEGRGEEEREGGRGREKEKPNEEKLRGFKCKFDYLFVIDPKMCNWQAYSCIMFDFLHDTRYRRKEWYSHRFCCNFFSLSVPNPFTDAFSLSFYQ